MGSKQNKMDNDSLFHHGKNCVACLLPSDIVLNGTQVHIAGTPLNWLSISFFILTSHLASSKIKLAPEKHILVHTKGFVLCVKTWKLIK